MNSPLLTIFGKAMVDNHGYYRIMTRREGNHLKLLHRLIFEKFNGEVPEGFIVHHRDGNKTNNCILNLELLSIAKHQNHHNVGNDTLHRKISLKTNRTGYRRVGIQKSKSCKQGFSYRYRYYENGMHKAINCVTLEGLKEKVLARGLIWEKFEEETV